MKKRLFIAVDISDEARRAAARYVERMSEKFRHISVKWERPEKFHLTLKFLGTVDEDLISSVNELITRNAAATREFQIELVGTGAFPAASRPRVLWLGVNEPTGEMNDLARRIDLHSAELGFEPEIKIFKPHLTLARIRDPRGAREIARSHVANDFGPVQFTCSELVLYESHIDKAGSLHEKLHAAGFGA